METLTKEIIHNLRYLIATELPNGDLNLKLTREGRAELKNLEQREAWTIEHIILELIEDSRCNGGFDILMPEKLGALTESIIIGWEVMYDDDGELEPIEKVWWFPDYQFKDELKELKSRQGWTLTGGTNILYFKP